MRIHDFAMTCTIADSVFLSRAPDQFHDRIRKLIKACRALNEHRVKIVHGFWHFETDSKGVAHHSRSSLQLVNHYQTPEEVEKLADEAELLIEDVKGWGQYLTQGVPSAVRRRPLTGFTRD